MNTDIIDQANAIIVQGAEMVRRLREALEEERAERERLQRVADDLATALRRVNRDLSSPQYENTVLADYAESVRWALDRHGLLRPQDRPEMLPDTWKRIADAVEDGPTSFSDACPDCGANPGQPCTADCEDRR